MSAPGRPRVLLLVDWYAPGWRSGGLALSCGNLVRALAGRVDFAVVTRDTDYTCAEPYPEIPADRWVRRPEGCEAFYFSREGLTFGNLRRLLRERAFDILYLNGAFSVPFVIWPLWILLRDAPPWRVVMAPRGMVQPGALSIKPLRKRAFLALLRWTGLPRRLAFHATSEEEAGDIRRAFGPGVEVHPGADLPSPLPAEWGPAPKSPGEARFVYVSRVARKKNLRFLIERLALVEGRVRLDIYGPLEDGAYWAECEGASRRLPPNVTVSWGGQAPPDQVPRVLGEAHFFAMPTLGENFGHAILEALGAGRPVLLSDRTPWRGLEVRRAGWDLPLERPGEFDRAIREAVAMDQSSYDAWCRGARGLAEESAGTAIPEGTLRILGCAD